MKTDWNLLREMMNAAITFGERLEASGYGESDRDATIEVAGQPVSIHDILTSAWTLPETLRYRIIRDRHAAADDLAYVPEIARILLAMAQAGSELIGAAETAPAKKDIGNMLAWFDGHAGPGIDRAISARRHASK